MCPGCPCDIKLPSDFGLQLLDDVDVVAQFDVVGQFEMFLFVDQLLSLNSFPRYSLYFNSHSSLGQVGIALFVKNDGIKRGIRDGLRSAKRI